MTRIATLKTSTVIMVVVTALILTAKTVSAEFDPISYNLAPNPSFENGITNPNGWELTNKNSCNETSQTPHSKQEWDNTKALIGNKSISLQNINWQDNNQSIPGSWITSNYINIDYSEGPYYVHLWVMGSIDNNNLTFIFWVCQYDENGNFIAQKTNKKNYNNTGEIGFHGWVSHSAEIGPYQPKKVSKIKIGVSASCVELEPCSGSLWFDYAQVSQTGKLAIHTFEDINTNGLQDINEQNIPTVINLYGGFDCDEYFGGSSGGTDISGNLDWGLFAGQYSIKAISQTNQFTTSKCKNIDLPPIVTTTVFVGLTNPLVPYLSQKDPAWGQEEYDHANTIGPFFCGTTIKGCGCAITSSAMLLKYYGVDKSPTGEETNPKTLNEWLKANKGYAFGGLKWNSIAAYALKANQSFGTQKIKFTGVGQANNFTDLENELTNQRPAILEEPGHYILATQIQNPTYSINDPYFEDRKTLQSYSNTFRSTRKYEKTSTDLSAIYIMTPSPTKILMTNEAGKKLGEDPQTGQIFQEIPNGFYFVESTIKNANQENSEPNPSSGITTLVILTPQKQNFNIQTFGPTNYQIDFSGYDQGGDITSKIFKQTTSTGTITNYELKYTPEPGSQINLTQKIKIDVIPSNDKNQVFPKFGILPVAILTTSDFNTKNVDASSIRLGRNETSPAWKHKIYWDVDHDKDNDLTMLFNVKELGILKGDNQICLKGQTTSGTPFEGCDKILVKH